MNTLGTLTVLVVEDDPQVRDYLRRLLEELAPANMFRAMFAATLGEGVRMLATEKPHVCLLDLTLNGGGVSTLSHILAIDRSVPIVVLTGDDNPVTERRCLEMGAQDHVRKSWLRTDAASVQYLTTVLTHSFVRHQARLEAAAEFAPVKAAIAEMKPAHCTDPDSHKNDKDETQF